MGPRLPAAPRSLAHGYDHGMALRPRVPCNAHNASMTSATKPALRESAVAAKTKMFRHRVDPNSSQTI